MLAQEKEGQFAPGQFPGQITERGGGIGIPHAVGIAAGGQVHGHALGAPDRDTGVGHPKVQTRAIFDGAAIGVVALVADILQELIQQIAVGAVDFHAVEAGGHGVDRALAERLDHAVDLIQGQGFGNSIGPRRPDDGDVALRRYGAGGHRRSAVQHLGVRDPPHMPELQPDASALGVDGPGYAFPASYLSLGPDTGRARIADTHGFHRGRLGDDQAGGGALCIVFGHKGRGRAFFGRRTHARKRGHDDAVRQNQVAKAQGVEEAGQIRIS